MNIVTMCLMGEEDVLIPLPKKTSFGGRLVDAITDVKDWFEQGQGAQPDYASLRKIAQIKMERDKLRERENIIEQLAQEFERRDKNNNHRDGSNDPRINIEHDLWHLSFLRKAAKYLHPNAADNEIEELILKSNTGGNLDSRSESEGYRLLAEGIVRQLEQLRDEATLPQERKEAISLKIKSLIEEVNKTPEINSVSEPNLPINPVAKTGTI